MNELERIIALANHGIIRTPEAKSTKSTNSTTRILKEATGVCKDCGCQIDNCKPGCECKHDSHDASGDHWVAEEAVNEEDVTVDNAGNIAGYLDTIDEYVEQVFMTDDQTDPRDLKEMAYRIQNADDDIRTRELNLKPSNIRSQYSESNDVAEAEVNRAKELAGIFADSVEEAPTEEVVAEAPKLTVSFKNFMQWFFSDSGEDEYAGFGEEVVAEINRVGSVTYTAQDMLDRSGYIPGHIVAGGDEDEEYDPADLTLVETEENIQPAVETVEQNEDKGNE